MKKFLAALFLSTFALSGAAYAEHHEGEMHTDKVITDTGVVVDADVNAKVGHDGKHDDVDAHTETGAHTHGAADASKPVAAKDHAEHHDEKATH